MTRRNRPEGPYPYPSTPAWRDDFAAALADVPGANLPDDALARIAASVVNPKDVMRGRRAIVPEQIERRSTPEGEVVAVRLTQHPCANTVALRNERLAPSWAPPGSGAGLELPRARHTGHAVLEMERTSPGRIRQLYRHAREELERADTVRGYELLTDMLTNGQEQAGWLTALRWVTFDPNDPDRDVELCALEAPMGNNRTLQRLAAFGWEPHWPVTGPPRRILTAAGHRSGDDSVETDPVRYLGDFSARLNAALADPDTEPDLHVRARASQAVKLAVIDTYVIIGVSEPARFRHAVSSLNVREHVKPPLMFGDLALGQAKASALAAAYRRAGVIDEVTEEVLIAERPLTDLPGLPAGVGRSEAEDTARRLWQKLVLPGDDEGRRIVRDVFQERARSELKKSDVASRSRVLVAASARVRGVLKANGKEMNDRIAEHYTLSDVRNGVEPSEMSLRELIDKVVVSAGSPGPELRELCRDRVLELAHIAGLVDPDFGSAGADRRSLTNVVEALQVQPRRTAGLASELADARDAGREPREVDDTGAAVDGTVASMAWFNTAFPKTSASRRRAPASVTLLPGVSEPAAPRLVAERSVDELEWALPAVDQAIDDVEDRIVAAKRAALDAGEEQVVADPVRAQTMAKAMADSRSRLSALIAKVSVLSAPLDPDDPELVSVDPDSAT